MSEDSSRAEAPLQSHRHLVPGVSCGQQDPELTIVTQFLPDRALGQCCQAGCAEAGFQEITGSTQPEKPWDSTCGRSCRGRRCASCDPGTAGAPGASARSCCAGECRAHRRTPAQVLIGERAKDRQGLDAVCRHMPQLQAGSIQVASIFTMGRQLAAHWSRGRVAKAQSWCACRQDRHSRHCFILVPH